MKRKAKDFNRREFTRLAAAGAAALAWPLRANAAVTEKQTFTYKKADGLEIQADVYHAGKSGSRRPTVIWIHGGALILGDRTGVSGQLKQRVLANDWTIVSIDYRLAPETRLPAILEDVQDACRWVREQGPQLFGADPERIAITGGSAGGYLTLCAGFLVKPAPKALVSFWGYGEVAGEWMSRPDPFYAAQPAVPKDEAHAAVGKQPLTGAGGKSNRGRFYLYCRQHGIWSREVTGHDPDREPKAFDAFCPLRNVSAAYPPTLFVHGDHDTDVPYEQSVLMGKELARQGVEHELLTVRGGGHGLAGVEPAIAEQAYDRAAEFLKKRLG